MPGRGDETGKSPVVRADSFVENSIPELEARLVVLNTRKNSIRTTLQKYVFDVKTSKLKSLYQSQYVLLVSRSHMIFDLEAFRKMKIAD